MDPVPTPPTQMDDKFVTILLNLELDIYLRKAIRKKVAGPENRFLNDKTRPVKVKNQINEFNLK